MDPVSPPPPTLEGIEIFADNFVFSQNVSSKFWFNLKLRQKVIYGQNDLWLSFLLLLFCNYFFATTFLQLLFCNYFFATTFLQLIFCSKNSGKTTGHNIRGRWNKVHVRSGMLKIFYDDLVEHTGTLHSVLLIVSVAHI